MPRGPRSRSPRGKPGGCCSPARATADRAMLITTCSHCQARFRVTPQQLNTRQGQVRCGRCNQVFNGFQALERFPDDDTGARLLAAQEAAEREGARHAVETNRIDLPIDGPPTTPRATAEDLPPLETVQ